MGSERDLLPLIAAEAALRLGLAKPWEVAAALQAVWDAKAGATPSFEAEIARFAKLSDADVERLRTDVAKTLEAAGGDPARALARPGGSMLTLRSIAAAGPAGVASAIGSRTGDTGSPLHTVPESRYVEFHAAGEGGMGIVYWALDTEMNRQVAFKIVRPDVGSGAPGSAPTTPIHASPPGRDTPASAAFEELKARFLQEAWVTGGLEHPGVVPVYEMGQTPEGIPYYTMRFVRGRRTLATAIEEAKGQPFEKRLALLEPFLKVCDTVAYAHSRGVIHRDLKPANIALGEFGEVVLLDWGLARVRADERTPAASRWQQRIDEHRKASDLETHSAMGTPGFIAPEVLLGLGDEVGNEKSDVYSLGAILFEILTGRLPHQFQTFGEFVTRVTKEDSPLANAVDPLVPNDLSAVCVQALARDPELRTASAHGLAMAVRRWQAQSAIDREVETLWAEAQSAAAAIEGLSGNALLRQVERASGVVDQVLKRRPGHAGAIDAVRLLADRRESGIRERERDARRIVTRRAAVSAVILLAVGAGVAAALLDSKRREAELARSHEAREHARADVKAVEAETARVGEAKERERADQRARDAEEASRREAVEHTRAEQKASEAEKARTIADQERAAAFGVTKRVVEGLTSLGALLDDDQLIRVRSTFAPILDDGATSGLRHDDLQEIWLFIEAKKAGALSSQLAAVGGSAASRLTSSAKDRILSAQRHESAALDAALKASDRGEIAVVRDAGSALRSARQDLHEVLTSLARGAHVESTATIPERISPEDIQKLLTDGEFFVDYGLIGNRLLALIVSASGTALRELPNRLGELEAIHDEDFDERFVRSLQAVDAILIEPLLLPSTARRVFVSPDGFIGKLPLGLSRPSLDFSFVPSAAVLSVLLRGRLGAVGAGVLAIGPTSSAPGARGLYLRLPGAEAEARAVGDEVLVGPDANFDRVTSTLRSRERWRALHFCTGVIPPPFLPREERPIVLARTESNSGLIYSDSVPLLDIRADLVVLSGGNQASGPISAGEGMLGWVHALLGAGVPRVISTLWVGDDDATRALMVKFYELWNPKSGAASIGTSAALRAAQEYIRRRETDVVDTEASKRDGHPVTKRVRLWENPRFWAAWILWGLPS